MISNRLLFPLLCLIVLFSCGFGGKGKVTLEKVTLKVERFGTADGKEVSLYTLTNRNGVEAKITNFGGILVSLKVPDRNGHLDDVVLGYDNLSDYTEGNPGYLGALIGRYGNSIARGRFSL